MILLLVFLAGIPLETTPSWESQPGFYATGGGFADFNGDDLLDMAVANGNDMAGQPNHLFLNQSGTLGTNPAWTSADTRYSGHLAVGDLNNDGWPDLVVANYAEAYQWQPQYSTVYLNLGGTLETNPSWQPPEPFISFACALGDFDLDGDLDLAFACGESYSHQPDVQRLYRNLTVEGDTGQFELVWTSGQAYYGYDVAFADLNNDGWPDLVFGCEHQPNLVFLNQGGTFADTPSWQSDDAWGTLQVALADVNRDGFVDLATADNAQTGGISRFRLYLNQEGTLQGSPIWTSVEVQTYASTVAFGDVDGDGWPDLAAGGWWEPVAVYRNLGGLLEDSASWHWQPPSPYDLVCEKVTFAPVQAVPLRQAVDTLVPGTLGHARGWFYLKTRPIYTVDSVRLVLASGQSQLLDPPQVRVDAEQGAITLLPPVADSAVLTYRVYYRWNPPDLVVTNWENSRGNFGFRNLLTRVEESPPVASRPAAGWRIVPNPVRGRVFRVLGVASTAGVRLWSISGHRVPITLQATPTGLRVHLPPGLPQGVYLLRVGKGPAQRLLYLGEDSP